MQSENSFSMNLTPLPSLQKIILLKLAARACNRSEIKSLIEQPEKLLDCHESHIINEAVSSFGLPKILRLMLFGLMKPVMIEISSWILYIRHIHDEVANLTSTSCSCLDAIDLQENLQWQTVGLLDKHSTSLWLIGDERLDAAFRFVLACRCCSEDDILRLWWILSKEVRKKISKFTFLPIVRYWTHRLSKAEEPNEFIPKPAFPYEFQFDYGGYYIHAMYSFYEKLPCEVRYYLFGAYGRHIEIMKRKINRDIQSIEFENRVTLGLVNVDNVAALTYFLQRFERIKREKLLEAVARNHFISNELLVFCLSKMKPYQVTDLLRSGHGNRILSCFVNSPWQESLWTFINDRNIARGDVYELLTYMFRFKMDKKRWQDHDYASDAAELFVRYDIEELHFEGR